MSEAHPGSADQAGAAPAPTYQPTPAGSPLARVPIRFARGTIVEIDAHHYKVSVKIPGERGPFPGISYNPLAYIPRLNEEVGVAFAYGSEPGDENFTWVLGGQLLAHV
jgi:hypothetical protein